MDSYGFEMDSYEFDFFSQNCPFSRIFTFWKEKINELRNNITEYITLSNKKLNKINDIR